MLFPLAANSPRCKVFEKLNAELLYFLNKSITAKQFRRSLFSTETGQECWKNTPTKEKFKAVFGLLPRDENDRREIYDSINDCQNISLLFSDKAIEAPRIAPEELFVVFKSLTTHLFNRTKDLAGVITDANESIEEHYQAYVRANSELCFVCGTNSLAQNRFNVLDDEQWRSDYDHLLCKDKYPVYSCHPDNFLPTCHICNSKAKGALDALFCGSDRRRAPYPLPPLNDSIFDKITVRTVFNELINCAADENINPLCQVDFEYINHTADENEMIQAWIELYKVPQRVGARIAKTFCEYIASDCTPEDYGDFCYQIARKARQEPADMKITEWRFWWFRLYEWLNAQVEDVKRDAWALIIWKIQQENNNNNAARTYGI
tara:strand:- start:16993 stop:18120 length:1128 start_codon:yes stop_codon:yes gene_type:complete